MANDMLEQIIGDSKVTPVAKVNGQNVYTFEDAQKLNKRQLAEEKLFGKMPELGQRELTDDGMGYKRSRSGAVAVNPNVLYMNRYRVITKGKQKAYQVVLDYRSLMGQKSGSVGIEVPAYEVTSSEDGLKIKMVNISGEEFVNSFKAELREDDVKKILMTIEEDATRVSDKDAMVF